VFRQLRFIELKIQRRALAAFFLLAGCTAPALSATPAPSAIATASLAPTTTPTVVAATSAPPAQPTLAATVDVCGSLVRYASDGNFKLLNIDRRGTVSQYLLQVGRGSAPDDLGTANQSPFLVRIRGTQLPPDSGNPQATYLTGYTATRVTSCP
jgi:hypothetical protein